MLRQKPGYVMTTGDHQYTVLKFWQDWAQRPRNVHRCYMCSGIPDKRGQPSFLCDNTPIRDLANVKRIKRDSDNNISDVHVPFSETWYPNGWNRYIRYQRAHGQVDRSVRLTHEMYVQICADRNIPYIPLMGGKY